MIVDKSDNFKFKKYKKKSIFQKFLDLKNENIILNKYNQNNTNYSLKEEEIIKSKNFKFDSFKITNFKSKNNNNTNNLKSKESFKIDKFTFITEAVNFKFPSIPILDKNNIDKSYDGNKIKHKDKNILTKEEIENSNIIKFIDFGKQNVRNNIIKYNNHNNDIDNKQSLKKLNKTHNNFRMSKSIFKINEGAMLRNPGIQENNLRMSRRNSALKDNEYKVKFQKDNKNKDIHLYKMKLVSSNYYGLNIKEKKKEINLKIAKLNNKNNNDCNDKNLKDEFQINDLNKVLRKINNNNNTIEEIKTINTLSSDDFLFNKANLNLKKEKTNLNKLNKQTNPKTTVKTRSKTPEIKLLGINSNEENKNNKRKSDVVYKLRDKVILNTLIPLANKQDINSYLRTGNMNFNFKKN